MAALRRLNPLSLLMLYCAIICFDNVNAKPRLLGLYSMDSETAITQADGELHVREGTEAKIRLIGTGFDDNTTQFYLTPDASSCQEEWKSKTYSTDDESEDSVTATVNLRLLGGDNYLYMCIHVGGSDFEHQGSNPWQKIKVVPHKTYLLPLELQIILCVLLLILSGLFSGLNLGLMSLDQTELKIIEKVGSENEKKYVRRIGPLRKRGNFLLCTLLLGNVMVNSTFTILFDNMTNGLIAVISSTIGIVIFGEIIPQAVCSRHGLAVGAKTFFITVFFMIVTFPLSFPISLILDKILGEEMGQVYNKEKLQELIRMTADRRVLHDNEANIISGALQLTNKSVEDVMTKIEDVYMLEINTVLDFETLTSIMHHGYTRIPVYDGEKTNIVNLLNSKDLALIDPDDKTSLSTVCKFYDHKPLFVDYDVKLDAMLQEFLQGNSHMAIVQKLHNTEARDPYFENVGVITLEDVIEEILQSEIVDETDLKTDNRQKEVRQRTKQDYQAFLPDEQRSKLPKQLAFVAFQFLTTTIEPFSDNYLARNVLKNLMKKDIVINLSPTDPVTPKNYIYIKGTPSDRFVLILQGTVEVEIGDESMVFETGPFSYFGVECLNSCRRQSVFEGFKMKEYNPDFSVRAVTDVQYLCIQRAHYIAALRTTRMLRHSGNIAVNDAFEAEFEKATKTNSNRNSLLEGQSPPSNTALGFLKNDEAAKKNSTSSLDRLTFFHRKHDPLEGLYRIRRTGSDAKDQSIEYLGETDALISKPGISVRASRSSSDAGGGAMASSPSAESKKKPASSFPFSARSNHKLDFLKEHEDNGIDKEGGKLKEDSSDTHISPYLPASLSDVRVESQKENEKSADADKPPPYPSTDHEERVPMVEIKSAAAGEGNNVSSAASQESQVNCVAGADGERVPLMNKDTSGSSVL